MSLQRSEFFSIGCPRCYHAVVVRRDVLLLLSAATVRGQTTPTNREVIRKYLDSLLNGGEVVRLKGKGAEAMIAMAYHRMARIGGEAKYKSAAVQLAGRVVKQMRSSAVGILDIKEKGEKNTMSGGPPALGWYAAYAASVLASAGRMDDVQFVAGVLDRFPWHPDGWWSATVDVRTGQSLHPLDKPSPINKNCAMAMACAVVSDLVRPRDAAVAARLRERTLKCLRSQILPAQQADGYWHYGLTGRDPKNKDTIGYFMLSTGLLIRMRELAPAFADEELDKAIRKAEAFALKEIAPMTAPNAGKPTSRPIGGATPDRYDPEEIPKRSFQLAVLLTHGGYQEEAAKILSYALARFPYADRGQTGALCSEAISLAAMM